MRRHGLGAIHRQQQKNALYKEKSEELAQEQIKKLTQQIEQFKSNLEEFANKHKREIKRDAEFRRKFQEMCAYIGVDPLQSSNSFWTKLLGVGDFYYELGIQLIEICMASTRTNGGLMRLGELTQRVRQCRMTGVRRSKSATTTATTTGSNAGKGQAEVSADDVLRALSKLHMLGGGLKVVKCGSNINDYIVQSVARELSGDDEAALQLAQQNGGRFSSSLLESKLGWQQQRIDQFVNQMIMDGLVWVDEHAGQTAYWFPCFQ